MNDKISDIIDYHSNQLAMYSAEIEKQKRDIESLAEGLSTKKLPIFDFLESLIDFAKTKDVSKKDLIATLEECLSVGKDLYK